MVKGVSRQVIVVQGPEQELFDQAIFILKDRAVEEGITNEKLMQQARQAIRSSQSQGKKWRPWLSGAFWALSGGGAMGLLWLISVIA